MKQRTDLFEDVEDILDFGNSHEAPVYLVGFSNELMQKMPSYRMHPEGYESLEYDDAYENAVLMIELVEEDVYWAYLKDYSFPNVKHFGLGVYVVEDPDILADGEEAGDQYMTALLDIQSRIVSGEIDLDTELYDFYHVLPEGAESWATPFSTYSLGEAAGKLGVSVARASKMVEDRVLEGYRIGSRLLIVAECVDDRIDYIAKNGKPTRGMKPKDMPSTRREMHLAEARICYEWAKSAFRNRCSATDAWNRVLQETDMNENSAKMYINAILGMLRGGEIGYHINQTTVDYCLDSILHDFGPEALKTAQEVCMRQYESSKREGRTCLYYKRLALKKRS